MAIVEEVASAPHLRGQRSVDDRVRRVCGTLQLSLVKATVSFSVNESATNIEVFTCRKESLDKDDAKVEKEERKEQEGRKITHVAVH